MKKTRLALGAAGAAAVLTAGIICAAAATAAPARPHAPLPGNTQNITYACTGAGGTFDYYEYRSPLPHPCRYSGETREALPTLTLAQGESFPVEIATSATTSTWEVCQVQPVEQPGTASNQLGLSCTQLAASSS